MNLHTKTENCFHAGNVAKDAMNRLQTSSHFALRTVSCDYKQGVLFLRGRVPSFYQKQLAQEAMVGLPGVTQIVNQTEVAVLPT